MRRKLFWTLVSCLAVVAAGAIVRKEIATASRTHEDDRIDEALDESFPASDPPSYSAAASQANGAA